MIGIRKNREKEWFDGVCTKKRNKGLDSTITITKILYKTKIEKTIRTNSCRILEMKKTS
jgi:ribosomal protein L19